jgi:hypothetical protein
MRRTRATAGLAAAACLAALGCRGGGEPAAGQAPAAAPAEATTTPRSCAALELTPLRVVRLDEPQHRLFTVAPVATEAQVLARVHDLETCFGFTEWGDRWHLSVFSDAALARYKDDPQVADAVADGRWARAYLTEYDATTRRLTRRPAGR